MKRKFYSLMLALTVCVSMAFSTSNPVKAESAHANCEHEMPPKVEKTDTGDYNTDDTYHWKVYIYTVRCSRCNNVMEVTPRIEEKEMHVRYGNSKECAICKRGY